MGKSLMTCFFDSQRQMKSEENVAKSADRRAPCNRLHVAFGQAAGHAPRRSVQPLWHSTDLATSAAIARISAVHYMRAVRPNASRPTA